VTGLSSLLVVDDHWLVRLGLTNLFSSLRHFALVADAATAAGAVAAARQHAPDVVIMDVACLTAAASKRVARSAPTIPRPG